MSMQSKFSVRPPVAGPTPEWAKHLPVMLEGPTGRLTVTQLDPNDRLKLGYEWEGGDIIAITYEFMECADHPDFERIGDTISIGPYRLKMIGRDPWRGWVLAERIDP